MLGANFTVESIMTDLCREIISVSSLVLDLNNHFIDAMFMEIAPRSRTPSGAQYL